MSLVRETIVGAIPGRRRLLIKYPPGRRVVEPHAFGIGSSGQILLRAFQIEGVSLSGEHINWKLLRIDRLEEVVQTDDVFDGPRPEYKRGDRVMTRGIIAEL